MSLNDAHNFCALDAVGDEIAAVLALISEAYAVIGIAGAGFRLSRRDDGGKYAGSPRDVGAGRGDAARRARRGRRGLRRGAG